MLCNNLYIYYNFSKNKSEFFKIVRFKIPEDFMQILIPHVRLGIYSTSNMYHKNKDLPPSSLPLNSTDWTAKHWSPTQARFSWSTGHRFPPCCLCRSTFLFLRWVPYPQVSLHLLHDPHSSTKQSVPVMKKLYRVHVLITVTCI